MRLNTPSFWYGNGPAARLQAASLLPASALYLAGHTIHQLARRPYKSNAPLICVGNLVAGGSGKTPVALALMQIVLDNALAGKPCFLSRGYGGNAQTVFVDRQQDSFRDVGDEPLLLARKAPAIVSPNRKRGIVTAESHHHDLIIMDDGLQNPVVVPHLAFVVIDGYSGFGNGLPLPAGPLREPLKTGLSRTDAFVLIGEDRRDISALLPTDKPVFTARLAVDKEWLAATGAPYIAFSGIGRPEKFRATIERQGLKLAGWHAFPDHYPFTEADLKRLDEEATRKNARLLTTEKDAVRIPHGFHWISPLDVMPVHLEWTEPDNVKTFLTNRLNALR